MSNVLEIKNLSLFFGEYQALYDVSLDLKKSTITALAGESGCGKSITAMSIIRLLPKSANIKSGQIIFNGDDLLQLPISKMRNIRGNKIALIPQDPMTSLNPLYTIENQLVESIKVHSHISYKQAKLRALEALDMVKIPDAKNKIKLYPHEFSGGMKQRVIIAMGLATKADLIIADEPTTALDVTIQKQIMDLIDEIKKEYGTSILLISHDLALVSNYADSVAIMYSGHIIEKASGEDFFRNPKHPYSKALLNSLPSKNPALKLKTIQGAPPSIQEIISGCKFNPRCDYCDTDICTKEVPEFKEILLNHFCACHKI